MVINILALLIPITPGNAGTFELAVMAPLLAFRIMKADAVMYALALHLCDLIPILVIGLFFFRSTRTTIKEFKEEGEKEEILDQVDIEDEPEEVMVEKDGL